MKRYSVSLIIEIFLWLYFVVRAVYVFMMLVFLPDGKSHFQLFFIMDAIAAYASMLLRKRAPLISRALAVAMLGATTVLWILEFYRSNTYLSDILIFLTPELMFVCGLLVLSASAKQPSANAS